MGVFCFSQRSETKNDPLADRGERVQRWWEAGVVGVASAKLARSFGARPALIRTAGKGTLSAYPALGCPPERHDVEHRRAKAPPCSGVCLWQFRLLDEICRICTPATNSAMAEEPIRAYFDGIRGQQRLSYAPNIFRRCLMQESVPMPEPFVDAERAADYLSMSRKTLLAMARRGDLPGHPLGCGQRKVWKFRLSELDHWMETEVNLTQRLRSCSRRIS